MAALVNECRFKRISFVSSLCAFLTLRCLERSGVNGNFRLFCRWNGGKGRGIRGEPVGANTKQVLRSSKSTPGPDRKPSPQSACGQRQLNTSNICQRMPSFGLNRNIISIDYLQKPNRVDNRQSVDSKRNGCSHIVVPSRERLNNKLNVKHSQLTVIIVWFGAVSHVECVCLRQFVVGLSRLQ